MTTCEFNLREPSGEVTITEDGNKVCNVTNVNEVILQGSNTSINGTFDLLTDTNFTSLQDNDIVKYDLASGKWINATTEYIEDVNWGEITGTLSDQTDLQSALNAKQDNITVTDSSEINFTFSSNDITASLIAGSIDETKLDTSVNTSLDLADSALQSGDNISELTNDSGYITGIDSDDVETALGYTPENIANKNSNNGYAGLDSGGKVPSSLLPNTVMDFKGSWNASTNTPTLIDGTGNAGDVYLVSVDGTQDLGSGSIDFIEGDWVVYNGSIWEKSINSNKVVSVNGEQGVVELDLQDVTDVGATTTNNITANSFITSGGASTDFVKGDGSLDGTTYLDTTTAGTTYVPYTGATSNVDLGSNDLYVEGNVGIGTDSPSEMLELGRNGKIRLNSSFGSRYTTIEHASTGNFQLKTSVGGIELYTGGTLKWKVGESVPAQFVNTGVGIGYTTGISDNDLAVSGNVGIGTDSPDTKLTINNGSDGVMIKGYGANPSGTRISFLADDGDNAVALYGWDDGGLGQSDLYLGRSVSTGNGIIVKSDGNVGIGTNSPNQKLHVEGNSLFNPPQSTGDYFKIQAVGDLLPAMKVWSPSGKWMGSGDKLQYEFPDANHAFQANWGGDWVVYTADPLTFKLRDSEDIKFQVNTFSISGSGTTALIIKGGTGNVGIGTTSPSEKLEVNGKIKATDINFSGLPTSTSGLSSGDVWNDSGTLKIV